MVYYFLQLCCCYVHVHIPTAARNKPDFPHHPSSFDSQTFELMWRWVGKAIYLLVGIQVMRSIFAAPPLLSSFTVGQKSAWYSRDCQLFFPLHSFLCTLFSPLSPSALSWIPFVPPLCTTLQLYPLLFLHPGQTFTSSPHFRGVVLIRGCGKWTVAHVTSSQRDVRYIQRGLLLLLFLLRVSSELLLVIWFDLVPHPRDRHRWGGTGGNKQTNQEAEIKANR